FARDNESDVLIVGAEDHKTGQASDFEARLAKLERWTRDHFPFVGEITDHWSGQVMESVDGTAYIGRNPGNKNVYVVTGDSGNGMTHGTIAGIMITDLIAGRENPWTKLYDPSRKTLKPAVVADYVAENANVAAQLRDYVTPGDEPSADKIKNGGGAILRDGARKIAAYRDESGTLHEFSAVCPHLKCIVRWDSCEKTWDCPCHGSRFDALGRVLNGPVGAKADPARMISLFDHDPPETGRDPSELLAQLERDVFPNNLHVDHPRFFAFVPGPNNFVSTMADALAAGFNIFNGTWLGGSAAAAVELGVVRWLCRICGFPDAAGGLFVSGGSMANLTALVAARRSLLKDRVEGATVYFSDQTHSSIERALRVIGFAPEQMRKLRSDENFRLSIQRVRGAIGEDRAKGLRQF